MKEKREKREENGYGNTDKLADSSLFRADF
jgi:hypothetical protein